jgi:tetratricopeptide (TPR) repeat protein
MIRSIICGGVLWLIIVMAWGNLTTAATPLRDSTKQPVTQNQPAAEVSIPSSGSQDQKSNVEALSMIALAAIDAARHSVEETKQFYAQVTQIIVWAAGIISLSVIAGGFTFLKSRAEAIAEQTAMAALAQKKSEMEDIQNKLTVHFKKYEEFHLGMELFKDKISSDLRAAMIIIPRALELTRWIGEHGHKSPNDPSRPNPKTVGESALKASVQALSFSPTDSYVLAMVYSNQGVANSILGRHASAEEDLVRSLKYYGDSPNVLYNLACCACVLGHLDDAKQYIRRVISQTPERAQDALNDSDFARLHSDQEFLQLLGRPDQGRSDQGEPDQGEPPVRP